MNPNESALEAKIEDGSGGLEDYLWLGRIYLNKGDYNQLLELYGKASDSLPRNEEKARIIYEKGEILNLLGKKEEALVCFENSLQLVSREKETPLILYIMGMSHYSSSLLHDEERGYFHAKQALKEYQQLLGKFPDYEENPVAFLHLGHLYLRFMEFDKAIEAYKKALEASEDDETKVWCLCGIASVYKEKGEYARSEENYEQALKIAGGSKFLSNIYFEIGKMYFDSNRTDKATQALENALNYLKNDPVLRGNKGYLTDIYWHLGTSVYYLKDYDKAIGYLIKVVENIDGNHKYYCNSHITLGHSYVAIGDSEKGREHYSIVLLAATATEEELEMVNECLKRIEKEWKA